MATADLPQSALRYKRLSTATARRAVREARRGRPNVHAIVVQHQVAQARLAEPATALMLAEQGLNLAPEARLSPGAFTTSGEAFADMLTDVETDWAFSRLVASLVQDAGRAAQGVAQASRPNVGWTRVLTPPSCSRCAVLAGKFYRYSDGFLRHPGDDCTTIPTRQGDDRYAVDPVALAQAGMVTGLSKADMQALKDGADFNQIVNVRSKASGLQMAGRTLTRAGRPTPEGIYRMATDRGQVMELLARYGYVAA